MGNFATIKNDDVNPHLFKYKEGNNRRTSTLLNPVVNSHLNLTQFSLVNYLWFQDTTPLLFSRLTGCSSYSLPPRHPSSQIYISRQAPSPQLQIHFSSCLLCITPWMFNGSLNRFNTEFLVFSHKLALPTEFPMSANGNHILLVAHAKTPIVILDDITSSHIVCLDAYSVSKTCWLHSAFLSTV